jgi:Ca-activated chloride channel family protein
MLITNPILPIVVILVIIAVVFMGLIIGMLRSHGSIWKKIIETVITVLICICIYFINLRVMVPSNDATVTVPSLNVLFVVDSTMSMWAEDYDGDESRIDGAREACNNIMDEFSGSSFALITFSDKAEVRIPLTPDRQSITDALDYLYMPSKYVAKGSNMNSPVDEMDRILQHMKADYEDRETIVFIFSDGEETLESDKADGSSSDEDTDEEEEDGDEEDSSKSKYGPYSKLLGKVDGGAVIGIGSEEGATMEDEKGNHIYDPTTGEPAISCIGEDCLETIASKIGIEYIHMEEVDDIDDVVESIITDAKYEASLRDDVENKEDTYFYGLPVLMSLLIIEILLFRK